MNYSLDYLNLGCLIKSNLANVIECKVVNKFINEDWKSCLLIRSILWYLIITLIDFSQVTGEEQS